MTITPKQAKQIAKQLLNKGGAVELTLPKDIHATLGLSGDQFYHLERIISYASREIDAKYKYGAASHKDKDPLLNKSALELVDDALLECIDQLVYLITLKEKLGGVV